MGNQLLLFFPPLKSCNNCRAQDKVHIFISKMPTSLPNPMFDHLLESSRRDDSDKWSNVGFGEEKTQVVSIEDKCTHLIWSSELSLIFKLIDQCKTILTMTYITISYISFALTIGNTVCLNLTNFMRDTDSSVLL